MPIVFFQKEVQRAQERFNQTFGMLVVCDLGMRQAAILSICFLGNLERKIGSAANKNDVREKINKFMKIRNVLNSTFDQIENHLKERRVHGNSNDQTRCPSRTSNIGR